jgi:hypothetical protein
MGHVTPELYSENEKVCQVSYFVEEYYKVPNELASFFNGKTRLNELKYTKIKINTPSKYLTEDLWIKNSASFDVVLANIINRYVWVWGIIFFTLSSCLASMLAGIITFGKDRPAKKSLALLGLWNFLSLIGFCVISFSDPELKTKPRKGLFVFLFTLFFLLIAFGFEFVLAIPLLSWKVFL